MAKLIGVLSLVFLVWMSGCGGNKGEETRSVPSEEKASMVVSTPAVPVEQRAVVPAEKGAFKVFPVYSDKSSPDNHFIPSGWMGDYMDIKFEDASGDNPHGGATCIKVTYNSKATGGARWAGIYWQYPANNWGGVDKSHDLGGATKLTFWIRGEKGGEVIQEIKMGGISGEYSDSDTAGVGPLTLTSEWKQYTIDLSGRDLTHIIGGFVWSTNIDVNPDGVIFYLDDIKYE
ncbi:MAG: hypothetical protein Q8L26_05540 [Candidatus Omnitrophota bacterium]|nr:hypothetical protein [Candidatus Omnitrophota bacterium]